MAEHRWLGGAHAEVFLATEERGLRVQATALRQTQGSTGAMGTRGRQRVPTILILEVKRGGEEGGGREGREAMGSGRTGI